MLCRDNPQYGCVNGEGTVPRLIVWVKEDNVPVWLCVRVRRIHPERLCGKCCRDDPQYGSTDRVGTIPCVIV